MANNKTPELEFNEAKAKTKNQHNFVKSILDNDITICDGPAGSGKAQPIDSIIYTPDGPKYLNDLREGDTVCTPDGKFSNIIGIYPQGNKKIYSLNFKQGYSVECCEDHLWKVKHENWNYKYKILTTKELLNLILKKSFAKHKIIIDVCKEVFFYKKDILIHPYILGCLLGDGCIINNVTISNINRELLSNISSHLIQNYFLSKINKRDDYILTKGRTGGKPNYYIESLKTYKLFGTHSHNKFIPKDYLYNSIEIRKEVLAGLLDTDGSISKNHIEYTTVSSNLADNIIELCHSLGGICKKSEKITFYNYKNFKKKGQKAYRIHIKFDSYNPFYCNIKRNKWSPKLKYKNNHLITSITDTEKYKECKCILIDNPNHLYLTNNFVPTHNTLLAVNTACKLLLQAKIDNILITRTIISAGGDLGAFTGNIHEKCEPYFYAHYNYLQKILGKNYKSYINNKIFIEPLEILRGRTYDKCVLILDEASNCDISQVKLFITRMGQDSKVVIIGDTHQNDINGNGLRFCLNYLPKVGGCHVCYLTYDDILRNPKLSRILEVFDKFGII